MNEVEARKRGEWDMFELLSSTYYGKQCYFLQDGGIVYSRISGAYLPDKAAAIKEFLDYIGGY